ncbi:hypothetical protein [Nocardioides euryhalodurans]|uniref:Uncharacterized protein n=1 Tax=Nocardioides euryhalodurans TaxID=2518370 RepID=A0A4V1BDP3_9ACTN|nr:hypothetical protein [Nocardioides euryhalodurans]QBR91822.1 hypothetical protein EXE57_05695 [Nocardioides euryhalodurans]
MSDIQKLLRDLKARAAGLDPESGKPTEGFYISFRPVALPIRPDDYANPYSPFGPSGPAINATKNPPPAADATDPKQVNTEPEADEETRIRKENEKQSAAVKAFVNTFFLVDKKLKIADDWTPYPGATSIHRTWYAIITGAQSTLESQKLTKEMEAKYAALLDVVQTKNEAGQEVPSSKMLAYEQYRKEHAAAVIARNRVFSEYKEEGKMADFLIDGLPLIDAEKHAYMKWEGFGYKKEVESALQELASRGMSPVTALLTLARAAWRDGQAGMPQGLSPIPYTFITPSNWADPYDDSGWTKYSKTDLHRTESKDREKTEYGAGASVGFGLWSAGGDFEHMDSKESVKESVEDLNVEFKYAAVDINRPWLDTALLNLPNWFLLGDYPAGCISDGTAAQELPSQGREPAFLPSIPVGLILLKDLTISWRDWKKDWSEATSRNGGSASVGFGPFSLKAKYAKETGKEDLEAKETKEGLKVEGIQLIGYVSQINPRSPQEDSSGYTEQPSPSP